MPQTFGMGGDSPTAHIPEGKFGVTRVCSLRQRNDSGHGDGIQRKEARCVLPGAPRTRRLTTKERSAPQRLQIGQMPMPTMLLDPAMLSKVPDMTLEAWFIGVAMHATISAQHRKADPKQVCRYAIEVGEITCAAAKRVNGRHKPAKE